MENSIYQINISTNPKDLLDLATKIPKKHTKLATESSLNALVPHIWINNG